MLPPFDRTYIHRLYTCSYGPHAEFVEVTSIRERNHVVNEDVATMATWTSKQRHPFKQALHTLSTL